MKKTVLVLSSSPRKAGNSELLCDQFGTGATEAGHQVGKTSLRKKRFIIAQVAVPVSKRKVVRRKTI
jgi:multimeric flavodoxin WrbA